MIGKILCASLLLLAACANPKYVSKDAPAPAPSEKGVADLQLAFPSGTQAWITWEVHPTDDELGSFLIKTGRPNLADQSPVPMDLEGDLSVVLWHISMGHGSSPPVRVERLDVGTYRATRVFFNGMRGDWELRLIRKVNGTQVEQATLPIRY